MANLFSFTNFHIHCDTEAYLNVSFSLAKSFLFTSILLECVYNFLSYDTYLVNIPYIRYVVLGLHYYTI